MPALWQTRLDTVLSTATSQVARHQWVLLCREHAQVLVQHRTALLQRFLPMQRMLERAGHELAPDKVVAMVQSLVARAHPTRSDRVAPDLRREIAT